MTRLTEVIQRHVDGGTLHGATWLVSRGGEVEVGCAGDARRDSIYRIASMTKPIVAVAALQLVEECRLRLDDPVDELLPELADRKVLVDGRGPLDGETVPAKRPIMVRDVLTFELGLGMDFTAPWPQPLLERMEELGVGFGPPQPEVAPDPDEWMRRMGTLPLLYQPGERWLYHVGAEVLGVLIARAAGQPLDAVLRQRVFEPLGMVDTGFWVPDTSRLGAAYSGGDVFDPPDGQWVKPPAFPSGGGGLASTVDDFHAFARVLLDRGQPLLSRASVDAMTTVQVSDGVTFDASGGWGMGVGIRTRRTGIVGSVGSYGWDGGLGSSWLNDPAEDLVGIILTTEVFNQPWPLPRAIQDFWTTVYAGG